MPEQIVVKQSVKKEDSNAWKKIQLKHETVEIRGKENDKGSIVKVNALSDSGAENPVICEKLIEGMNLEQVGEVSLQSVAGKAEETYTMFTARLKNLLKYYVKSRQVNDDYGSLFDLFISDKLKESLLPGPLQFVLCKEGTECFKSSMIADLAYIHANNKIGMPSYSKQSYGSTVSYKKNSSGNGFRFPDKQYQGSSIYGQKWQSQSEINSPERKSYEEQDQKQVGWRTPKNTSMTEVSKPKGFGSGHSRTNDDAKHCHHCGSDRHLVRDCEKAKGNQNTREKRADFRTMRINSVHFQPSRENLDTHETHQNMKVNGVKSDPIWLDFYGNQFDPNNPIANQTQVKTTGKVNEVTKAKLVMKCGVNLKPNYQKIMREQIVVKQTIKKEESNALKQIQMKHVIVEIRGKETDKGSIVKVNALSDSGAEVPVISEELIAGMNLQQVGEASLQGVTGEAIPAKLVKFGVRICETDEETRTNQVKFTITPYVTLVCVCIAGMGSKEKFLLHPEIIVELKAIPQVIIKREEEVQANVITRAQRVQEEREEGKASDEEEREDKGINENENERNEQSDDDSSITSDRIRRENYACESDNLLECEDS